MHPRRAAPEAQIDVFAARWPCPSSSHPICAVVTAREVRGGFGRPAGPLATHMGIAADEAPTAACVMAILVASLASPFVAAAAGAVQQAAGRRSASSPSATASPPATACPQSAAFPAVLERALAGKGSQGRDRSMPASPATPRRRARPARLVGAGRHRRRHPRTRRQRHAARPRPGPCRAALDDDRLAAEGARHSRAARRHVCASRNLGPDYVGRFDAIYPDLAKKHGLVLYPFFLDGVAGERHAQPARRHPSDRAGSRASSSSGSFRPSRSFSPASPSADVRRRVSLAPVAAPARGGCPAARSLASCSTAPSAAPASTSARSASAP